VIGLVLARAYGELRVTAVELQPRLARLASRNAEENQLSARVRVVEVDLASREVGRALPGGSFDWVVSNPPYRPVGEGDPNPDPEEAIARHETRLTLAQLVTQARRVLRPAGRAALVYPAERLVSLLAALEGAGLRPVRLQLCHPRPGEPARLALVEAIKGARGGLTVEAPLTILEADGSYSTAAKRALGEPSG
jgi:tRNA1Val (adenine37-N6)-methyltransferase